MDEISMVGNTTLLHIHQRLKEIFGCSSAKLFAGISIITVGDLYQFPLIKKKRKQLLIRTDSHTKDDIKVIQSRCIVPSDPYYPSDALHI